PGQQLWRAVRQQDFGEMPVTWTPKTLSTPSPRRGEGWGEGVPGSHTFVWLAILAAVFLLASADSALAQTNPFGGARPPAPAPGIVGWLLAQQAAFYHQMSGLIRAAKSDGSAVIGLLGVSFVYGIFHAAGPGHGKAVISSYLIANQETWRRGIVLSFAS